METFWYYYCRSFHCNDLHTADSEILGPRLNDSDSVGVGPRGASEMNPASQLTFVRVGEAQGPASEHASTHESVLAAVSSVEDPNVANLFDLGDADSHPVASLSRIRVSATSATLVMVVGSSGQGFERSANAAAQVAAVILGGADD